jgi:hypothetical protein
MTRCIFRGGTISVIALFMLLGGIGARGQMPAGFELTLVDVDGTRKVLGQLPPSV